MKKTHLTLLIAAAMGVGAFSYGAFSSLAAGGHSDHSAHGQMELKTMAIPSEAGQSAFAAIAEIVAMLEQDPKTDWSRVNITALRDHLVDMDSLTTEASVTQNVQNGEIVFDITGPKKAIEAARRMVPAHAQELSKSDKWDISTQETPNGIAMIVKSNIQNPVDKITALGFFGIMATGAHHQPHHLGMANGTMIH